MEEDYLSIPMHMIIVSYMPRELSRKHVKNLNKLFFGFLFVDYSKNPVHHTEFYHQQECRLLIVSTLFL